ncbi:MAG: hypothetical protein VXA08_02310 [Alphaproteobacteria bacterium]
MPSISDAQIDGIVDAVARLLGDFLAITDDELPGHASLAQELHDGILYFPTRQKLDLLQNLLQAYEFTVAVHDALTTLCDACAASDHVELGVHAENALYYTCRNFAKPRGDHIREAVIGGHGGKLAAELKTHVVAWLSACDRMMCSQYATAIVECEDAHVDRFIAVLAARISRRLTRTEPAYELGRLTPAFFEGINRDEFERCRDYGQVSTHADLHALHTLLAMIEQTTDVYAIMKNASTVRRLVDQPPVELATAKLNLALLRRACHDGVDARVRLELFQRWTAQHAGAASGALRAAIDKITQWTAHRQPFINLLTNDGVRLPRQTFMKTPVLRIAPRATRTGLDAVGQRIVRLSSLIWSLAANGTIATTTPIASHVIHPVAISALYETRLVSSLLLQSRDKLFPGQRLLSFVQNLNDSQSLLDDAVYAAICRVSRHSIDEIVNVVHPESPIYPQILGELAIRTRDACPVRIPSRYSAFVGDALAVVVPILMQRRARLGIRFGQPSNAVADMLRTVARVRSWTPADGTLMLTKAELRKASPLTRQLLEALCREGHLCAMKRPYNRKTKKYATRELLAFDSALLRRVLAPVAHR